MAPESETPSETPRKTVRRETVKTVAAARPKSPFALPEGARVNESAQGVNVWERMLLKNLAANPEAAARWLQKKGYEAYLYEPTEGGTEPSVDAGVFPPSKMRIAVRKPGETDFKVVDPANFDIQDISDLFGDLIFGAITQVGMAAGLEAGAGLGGLAGMAAGGPPGGVPGAVAGGIVGGATGGALAGAGGEIMRQGLGNMVTTFSGQPPLNPELSTPEVGAQAFGGALALPATEGLAFLGRGAGRLAKATGLGTARTILSGIATLSHLSPEQLATAIENRVILLKHFDPRMLASSLAQRTMQFLTGLDESKTLEYQTAQQLLAQYGTGQVRLKPILEAIEDAVVPPFKEVTTTVPAVLDSYGRVIQPATTTVSKVLQTPGKFGLKAAENDRVRSILVSEGTKLARNAGTDSIEDAIQKDAILPVAQAETLKRGYAEAANYAATSLEKDAAKEAASGFLADNLRQGARESITDPVIRDQYKTAMDQAGKKLGLAKELQKSLISKGAEEIEPEAAAGAPPLPDEIVQAANRPEAFFRTYLNKGARSGQKDITREFGRLWAPELEMAGLGSFEDQARLASTVAALGAEDSAAFGGEQGIHVGFAHFSFGGKPLGMTLGAGLGAGIGFATGGLPGAEKGALIGGGLGYYAASPRGSIVTASAIKSFLNKGAAAAEFPGRVAAGETFRPTWTGQPFGRVEVPIPSPAPFLAGTTASRTAGAEATFLEQQQAATRKLVASDSEAMTALSGIASEVRAMAAKNPNFTQDDMVAEFIRRKDEWLAKRKMTMAGSAAPAAVPSSTPPAP